MNPKTYQLEGEATPVAEEVTTNDANGRAAFAASENGVLVYRSGLLFRFAHQLAWYDREGKRLGAVGKTDWYGAVRLSPDEKNAALMIGTGPGRSDTWIIDLTTGVLTRMTRDSRSSIFIGPWSPDSQRFAVNRQSGGPAEVTVASGKTRVLATDLRYANDWSPDGSSLLSTDQNGHRLAVLALAGETTARIVLDTAYSKRLFRFSPDGKWVSYSSDESGRFEVFVAAFPSFGEKRQVSNSGGGASFWRKDGKEILYVAPGSTLMSAEINTGPRIEVGIPKPLFELPKGVFPDFEIAATGDGKRFLVIESDQSNQPAQILVVLNWAAELKQQ